MIHELKTTPEYFDAVSKETKTFEVRKEDRHFHIGDFLALNEFKNGDYTGRCILVKVTYILNEPQFCKAGYCTMGIVGCAVRTKGDVICLPNSSFSGIPVYGGKLGGDPQ